MSATSDAIRARDLEIVLTRVFDAPRELVWQSFTDPALLLRWWGPRGFLTTTRRMDMRPGGQWRFVMHGPDGRDYDNLITYLEIDAPRRLSYKHGGEKDLEPVDHRVTVTFETEGEAAERTKVTMRSVFPSKAARDFVVREYNAIEGGKQTLERLGEHLAERRASGAAAPADRPFVITRVFAAPRELVWRAWTEREHLMRWFGPKGCVIPRCEIDLRPGGIFHYAMQMPDGAVMWGKWLFRRIVPGARLEFVSSFSDEAAGITRHPFNSEWPLETLSTISFAEHAGIGRGTTVVVEWTPINAADAERRAFAAAHAGMQQGWSGTFEQLAGYLDEVTARPRA